MSGRSRLIEQLAKVGAPVLKGIISTAAPGWASKVADGVIDGLADSLGTSADPGAIADEIAAHPEKAADVLVMEDNYAAMAAQMARDVNETMRLEAQSTSWLQRNWRPIYAFELIAESPFWAYHLFKLFNPLPAGSVLPVMAASSLVVLYFTLRFGVLGVYTGGRSFEKVFKSTK